MKPYVEQEIQPNSVEISMGTLFRVRSLGKETKRIDVVIDIGEDNCFFAARLRKDRDGSKFFTGSGTGRPEVFGRIVGSMSPEEVIEAARIGARKMGYELTETQLNYLQESAKKGTRTLIL